MRSALILLNYFLHIAYITKKYLRTDEILRGYQQSGNCWSTPTNLTLSRTGNLTLREESFRLSELSLDFAALDFSFYKVILLSKMKTKNRRYFMKVLTLLSLLTLGIARADIPSYLSQCKNNFVLNFVELKDKMSYEGEDIYLLWKTYSKRAWKNEGFIKHVLEDYYGFGGHGCEMLEMTQVDVLGTEYRMFVGDGAGDCDGGNYYGVVLNWNKIQKILKQDPPENKLKSTENFVVAEIGDGGVYCPSPVLSINAK